MLPWDLILGSAGALVLMTLIAFLLAKDHQRTDRKRDELLDTATAGWKSQTDANLEMAAAWKERNRRRS